MKAKIIVLLTVLFICALLILSGIANSAAPDGMRVPILDVRWAKDSNSGKWFCAIIPPKGVKIHTVDAHAGIIFLYVADPNILIAEIPDANDVITNIELPAIPIGYQSATGKIHRESCRYYKPEMIPVYEIADPNDACKICKPE